MPQDQTHPIFISYRTADASTQAGRLRDSINQHLGWEAAFLDTSLKGGEGWPAALRQRVGQATVVLVLTAAEARCILPPLRGLPAGWLCTPWLAPWAIVCPSSAASARPGSPDTALG